jgi:hypothetical protein
MVDLRVPLKFIKTLEKFDGGENNNVDPLNIKDTEFVKLKDFKLDEIGNLVMRGGATAITNSSDSDEGLWIGKWIRNDIDNVILVGVDTKLIKKNGVGFDDILTGLTSDTKYSAESYTNTSDTNFLYFSSSLDGVYRISEDYTYDAAGCVAPTVAPTVATNGAGALTGDYYYSFSYLYEWGESNESPASDLISPSSEDVRITFGAIPSDALGVFIYRTVDGGTQRKQLAFADSGTYYDDELSDGALGTNAPTDNGAPRTSVDIMLFNDYMFYLDYANRDRMYYSKLQYPDIVGENDYDNPIRDYNNLPMKLSYTSNPSFLIVFYEKSIVAYEGTSPHITETDPMQMFVVTETLGTPSPNSVVNVAGDIIFFGNDNRVHVVQRVSLASTETVREASISQNMDGLLQGKVGLGLNEEMKQYFSGWYLDGKYYLLVATGNNSYLDTLLVIDFTLDSMPWVHHETIPAMFGLNIDNDGDEITALLSSSSPNLFQFDDGLTDAGASLSPVLETKHWDFGHPFNRKVVRTLKLMGEATPEYTFTVRVWFEKDAELVSKDFTVTGSASSGSTSETVEWCSSSTWGQGNWCYNATWSNVITNFIEDLPVMGDGEIMWFEIFDVSSTYRLKFKKLEIRGFVMRARP